MFGLFLLFSVAGCTETIKQTDVCGIYVPHGYSNNFDTIVIEVNGSYRRIVYNSQSEKVLDMVSEWQFNEIDRMLTISNYYHNLDDDLRSYPHLVQDTVGTGEFLIEINNSNRFYFCVGDYSLDTHDKFCYEKVN